MNKNIIIPIIVTVVVIAIIVIVIVLNNSNSHHGTTIRPQTTYPNIPIPKTTPPPGLEKNARCQTFGQIIAKHFLCILF